MLTDQIFTNRVLHHYYLKKSSTAEESASLTGTGAPAKHPIPTQLVKKTLPGVTMREPSPPRPKKQGSSWQG